MTDHRPTFLPRTIRVVRKTDAGRSFTDETIDIIVEAPITVEITSDDPPTELTTMATPRMLDALAVGLLHAEGRIRTIDDLAQLDVQPGTPAACRKKGQAPRDNADGSGFAAACSEPVPFFDNPHARVTVRLTPREDRPGEEDLTRRGTGLLVSTSGQRTRQSLASVVAHIAPVADELRVTPDQIDAGLEAMFARQQLRRATRGTHAIGIVDPSTGELVAMAEDVGRHNAADKVIGQCLLDRRDTRRLFPVLSCRVSLEMLLKCARAGIELLAAVSAPTTLALDVADRLGITVCGSIRDGKMIVYTHPHRVVGQAFQPDP